MIVVPINCRSLAEFVASGSMKGYVASCCGEGLSDPQTQKEQPLPLCSPWAPCVSALRGCVCTRARNRNVSQKSVRDQSYVGVRDTKRLW